MLKASFGCHLPQIPALRASITTLSQKNQNPIPWEQLPDLLVECDPVPTGDERRGTGYSITVIAMRVAEMTELTMNVHIAKPIVRSILKFDGERMIPAVESTPHANVMIYDSTYEGAELISKFMDADSEDTEAQKFGQGADWREDSAAFNK